MNFFIEIEAKCLVFKKRTSLVFMARLRGVKHKCTMIRRQQLQKIVTIFISISIWHDLRAIRVRRGYAQCALTQLLTATSNCETKKQKTESKQQTINTERPISVWFSFSFPSQCAPIPSIRIRLQRIFRVLCNLQSVACQHTCIAYLFTLERPGTDSSRANIYTHTSPPFTVRHGKSKSIFSGVYFNHRRSTSIAIACFLRVRLAYRPGSGRAHISFKLQPITINNK